LAHLKDGKTFNDKKEEESKISACLLSVSASLVSLLDFAEKSKKMKNKGQWTPSSSQVCFLLFVFKRSK